MYELIGLTDTAYYIESPAKIGLVRLSDTDVCLIDSGNDKDAGRKVYKILEANGWRLTVIYNTHSHADHIGGNAYLQRQTGCAVVAPGMECDFTNHPILESTALYGGYPSKDLRHKFLLAQPSVAQPLEGHCLPDCLEAIPLRGHSFDMVGFRTADDVVYLADALSSKQTLDKYAIGYLYDVEAYLQTLETIKTMTAKQFVPSHAAATDDIAPLAQYNIDKVNEVGERIVSLCASPVTFETLLKALFDHYALCMTFEQYALVGSTVRSYLSWLKDTGRLTVLIDDNQLLWERL